MKFGEVVSSDLLRPRGPQPKKNPLDDLPAGELTIAAEITPVAIRARASRWNATHKDEQLRITAHILKDGRVAVLKTRTEEGK